LKDDIRSDGEFEGSLIQHEVISL